MPRADSISQTLAIPVGAGLPAKQAARCMAPASPVFAGEPAPTEAKRTCPNSILPSATTGAPHA
ncbi:hypothetical protein EJA05_15010 [Pseudomonas oryziphila]|uniref:Uncharacterized protein n=1 Tax=Pseudomonas entomophila TaxID=312306 RepID=A0A3S8UKP2_9PSED|nr:hypothetical protein EJA05_15010 [Pseudomonas oryziphila]